MIRNLILRALESFLDGPSCRGRRVDDTHIAACPHDAMVHTEVGCLHELDERDPDTGRYLICDCRIPFGGLTRGRWHRRQVAQSRLAKAA